MRWTNRALRWGKAIGEAGKNPLTEDELIRLQKIIIESKRFTKMGFRTEDGNDWIENDTGPNAEFLYETIDYYRYFDATKQAEFLFDCVQDTINRIMQ